MILKPDNGIKGQMVLVNWMKHKKKWSDDQIQDILGYKSVSSAKVLGLFSHKDKDETEWPPIPMSSDCFLWDWKNEACDFLYRRRSSNLSDKARIDSIVKAIYEPHGSISQKEAAEWSEEINERRRKI